MRLGFGGLPGGKGSLRVAALFFDVPVTHVYGRGQFYHVSIRIAEIYGAAKPVVGDPACLHAARFALGEHGFQRGIVHSQRDMQVKVMLVLELERLIGTSKKARKEPSSIS